MWPRLAPTALRLAASCSSTAVLLAAAPGAGPPAASASTGAGIEGERMHVADGTGHVVRDARASGRHALLLTGSGRARASLKMAKPARLRVAVRARACAGPPRLTVVVDRRRRTSLRVTSPRWATRSLPLKIETGAHTVSLRLANPHRSKRCRRSIRIDRLEAVPASHAAPGRIWRPEPGTTWQWQLSTPVDQSVDAQVFDIDLFDNSAGVVAALKARGRRVVCYMSAGSFEGSRPDAGSFPSEVIGNQLEGWPGERWLDIRRLDVLGPILERRLDLCRAKGFDGVEPDNADGYANTTGFSLTAADQLAFNRFLAQAAHARGLSVGLKNNLEQVPALEPYFDWALNEQCFQYRECERLLPFVKAGKAVFNVEYDLSTRSFCAQANRLGFKSMRKRLALDAWREPCW
jgi:hypothetical protein